MEDLRQLFTVVGVLMLLGVSLYWLRKKGVAQFRLNTIGGAGERQLQSIERLSLTAQHSLHLIRVGGRTVLVAVSPTGCSVLDGSSGIAPIGKGTVAQ